MIERCSCGRPRSTSADLRRWFEELAEWKESGKSERDFNPEWSRVMCWTKPGFKCHMRPLVVS